MAIVSLKIGPRSYKFSCADGREDEMQHLAEGLDKRAEQLTQSLGFMQEGQMLAMICLLLAEEKSKLEKETHAGVLSENEARLAENLNNLAAKITLLSESLKA